MKVKRLISIFVVVALLTCFVVFPVSADIDSDLEDGKLLNLLDYGNSLESENNYQSFYGSAMFTYDVPSFSFINYVEVLIYSTSSAGNPLSGVNIYKDGIYVNWLSLVNIGDNYYRAIINLGALYRSFHTLGIQVVATDPSIMTYTSVISLNVGLFGNSVSHLNGTCKVTTYEDGITAAHTPSSNAEITWECNASWDLADYAIDLYTPDFWKYDYIDFTFLISAVSLDSLLVSTVVSGSAVPFDVSYINNSLTDSSAYFVQVRVDVSNLKKNDLSDFPCVMIWGVSRYGGSLNSIIVSDIVGHLKYEQQNPVIFWFKKTFSAIGDGFSNVVSKLTSGFNSVVNAITGNSAAADQAGEEMKEAADDLNDMGAAFDQVETPDIDAAALTGGFTNFSPGGLTVLAAVTSNQYVTAMLVVVFTFALCGFIFFGKKR